MTMLLHCGGKTATFEEVCSIEPPLATHSYRPVPHGDVIRLVEEELDSQFGLREPVRSFGLANEGKRMFGTLTYPLVNGETERRMDLIEKMDLSAFGIEPKKALGKYAYSIALRNSYDQSMKLGICGGANVFACDNLALTGSDFVISLLHTPGVWERAVPQVMMKVRNSMDQFRQTVVVLETMKTEMVDDVATYETIGVGMGTGVLTAQQANRVFKEYRDCERAKRYADGELKLREGSEPPTHTFGELHGTVFALYQHFTEALKLGSDIHRKMDKYTGTSRLFERRGLVPPVEQLLAHV